MTDKGETSESVKLVEHWTFTMDYETHEIVIHAFTCDGEVEIRACEKDVRSMQHWFRLAKLRDGEGE